MKKLETVLILLLLLLFFCNASEIARLSQNSLNFWFTELVPTLFLSILLIQILSSTSFFHHLAKPLQFLCPVLNINTDALGFIISCVLTGCPSNVALINEACETERITPQMAKRLMMCTPVATVSFLIMSAGTKMLHSQKAGVLLWIIQVLSSFFLLCTTRKTPIIMNPQIQQKKHSVTSALFKTGSIVFLIGGYLLMFQTIAFLAGQFLPDSLRHLSVILSEFSYGCKLLAQNHPFEKAFVLISALCGFQGLSVHFQALSLSHQKTNVLQYLMFRIIQSLFSFLSATAVLPLLSG